jgi:hypothetical protein
MRFNINDFELDPDVVPLDPADTAAAWYDPDMEYPVTVQIIFHAEPRFQQLIAWCKEQKYTEIDLNLELQPQQGLFRVVEQEKLNAIVVAVQALELSGTPTP